LVCNRVRGWARVCGRWLLIGKVKAVESGSNVIICVTSSESVSTGSKDSGSLASAALWTLLVRKVKLSRADRCDSRAGGSVWDESVTTV
jgi:hypothetical protein